MELFDESSNVVVWYFKPEVDYSSYDFEGKIVFACVFRFDEIDWTGGFEIVDMSFVEFVDE